MVIQREERFALLLDPEDTETTRSHGVGRILRELRVVLRAFYIEIEISPGLSLPSLKALRLSKR